MRQVTSWGGGCTGACVEAEGEMRQLLSPSLPEAGLPPPLLGWAAAPSYRGHAEPRAGSQGEQPQASASLCSSVASECLRTGGRACLRDWENLCAAHAGLGLPRSAPVWAPPCCLPHSPDVCLSPELSPDAASGPSGVSAPAGPQMAQAVPENRRAVDQGIKQQQRRQRDVCETFPRGL